MKAMWKSWTCVLILLPLTACGGGSSDGNSQDSTAAAETQPPSGAGADSVPERDVAPAATGSALPDPDSIPMLDQDGTVTNPDGCPATEPSGTCDGAVTACVYDASACACWAGQWQCLDTTNLGGAGGAPGVMPAMDEVLDADASAPAEGSEEPSPDAGSSASSDGPAPDGG